MLSRSSEAGGKGKPLCLAQLTITMEVTQFRKIPNLINHSLKVTSCLMKEGTIDEEFLADPRTLEEKSLEIGSSGDLGRRNQQRHEEDQRH